MTDIDIKSTPLLEKLKAELAFENPEERMAYYHNTASEYYKTLPDEMSHPRIEGAKFGMRTENARLRKLHKLYEECVGALDTATDLLPTPEHMQDDEWFEREKTVHATFAKLESYLERSK